MSFRIADRYRALREANGAALAGTTPEDIFRGMCIALRKLVSYDRAGLTVYDPDHDGLKIVALHGRYENSFFRIGDLLGRGDSQSGWTFQHQRTTIRRDLAKEYQFASEEHGLREGLRSSCSVPLVVHGNSVGAVTILSSRRNAYATRHGDIVQEVSNQITLAVNSLMLRCPLHTYTRLICPKCIGSGGGQMTTSKYREQLSQWGKKGGRGHKKPPIV